MNTKLAILASIMLSSATASMSASANEGNLTGRRKVQLQRRSNVPPQPFAM